MNDTHPHLTQLIRKEDHIAALKTIEELKLDIYVMGLKLDVDNDVIKGLESEVRTLKAMLSGKEEA